MIFYPLQIWVFTSFLFWEYNNIVQFMPKQKYRSTFSSVKPGRHITTINCNLIPYSIWYSSYISHMKIYRTNGALKLAVTLPQLHYAFFVFIEQYLHWSNARTIPQCSVFYVLYVLCSIYLYNSPSIPLNLLRDTMETILNSRLQLWSSRCLPVRIGHFPGNINSTSWELG